ncbi:MAG: amidohydrolase family protein [Candidatus Marinimicrobia bacterium]|nr:amidohydrolase family protein [Candidatus Neomarinimicrobiota bacterium]MCF7829368.1 amidohydrolase family protein [Candidatus Neomarinimicrobiota bacterium]MCF7880854.1 amidohydrolase family protein [Candidatus Neomarinimicrobiota bacterium]
MNTLHEYQPVFSIVVIFLSAVAFAQTEPVEGIRDKPPGVYAFVDARIVQSPDQIIENGTVVIRDGIIDAVGTNVTPPSDAQIIESAGKTLYPGFIEMYLPIGDFAGGNDQPKSSSSTPGHWNPLVHPERDVLARYQVDSKQWNALRSSGFTTALVLPNDGIFRGSAAMITLNKEQSGYRVLQRDAAQVLSFQTYSDWTFPNSLMGSIALIRQTFLDAQWYGQAFEAYEVNPHQPKPKTNDALRVLSGQIQQKTPLYFAIDNQYDLLRAQRIAKETGLPYWIRGSGHEYWQLSALQNNEHPLVIPVDFPKTPPVEDSEVALDVSLTTLRHWYYAPENPARLAQAGIPFAITSNGHSSPDKFYAHLREAVRRGLAKKDALASLTTQPASILGLADRLGTIEQGKVGNLVVTSGDIFTEVSEILDVWIDGTRHKITPEPSVNLLGSWELTFSPTDTTSVRGKLLIQNDYPDHTAKLLVDTLTITVPEVSLTQRRLSFRLDGKPLGMPGVLRFTGVADDSTLTGSAALPDGIRIPWKATVDSLSIDRPQEFHSTQTSMESETLEPPLPPVPFGRRQLPEQPDQVLIRNATIWTVGPGGRIEQGDMLVSQGKIQEVGKNLDAPSEAQVIDATGKHVTPGLIDAHSHTGIDGGGNEMSQAVTSEVRIRDVLNRDDPGFYGELSGGLTVSHELHGSANPIGGQNAIIKLRWGASVEEMLIAGAPPTIKFALGENVKQSHWGDEFTTRYPQTRMGVEQLIRDRFKDAIEYQNAWTKYRNRTNSGHIPPRRDLELEAITEVLQGDRIIHCHSYRQDELLMFMHVAEEFGITVGTFQHVLEGYKVADIIQQHGANASTFSDWWGYKFEVYDAIPFNGVLMQDVGVLVSFNSDSEVISRHLHVEAAKAMKYGGLSETEALKLITINPAKQLHIDQRVGSLEAGKDADFVVWNGPPLSAYTRCEQTWIDGRKYFDRSADLREREAIAQERNRLIQRVLTTKNGRKENREGGE